MKLYMHAGSLNHGCEAIVRSILMMLNSNNIVLYSDKPEEDILVGLDKLCKVRKQGGTKGRNLGFITTKAMELLFHTDSKFKYLYKNILDEIEKEELYLSIGGDNYCYRNNPNLFFLNREINDRGGKTGLWGCSIEPDSLLESDVIEDMNRYSFITARESITYNALVSAGVTSKLYLHPDTAFTLACESFKLPSIYEQCDVVGMNVSPLVEKRATDEDIIYKNYRQMVQYILENTKMGVVFIPHVCKVGNDDRIPCKRLYDEFRDSNRVDFINWDGKQNCMQLKYAISKCRFLVAARTHASIAAYSTKVPTLVVGYSVKARGIARDLFESFDHYVVDVSEIKSSDNTLKDELCWIMEHEEIIRKRYESIIPAYIQSARDAVKYICGE